MPFGFEAALSRREALVVLEQLAQPGAADHATIDRGRLERRPRTEEDTDNDTVYDDNNWDLVYDAAGNLTDDKQDYKFIYDPLGRLVRIDNQSSQPVSEYRYDGLGRRIAFRNDTDADADINEETRFPALS